MAAATSRMAASRQQQRPVGSVAWVQDENAQVTNFCSQELEDFTFAARNEMDWLNEHMAEIFTKESFCVGDVFKTPGKLRGKTPRTKFGLGKSNGIAARDELAREPLSDIFAPNMSNMPRKASPGKQSGAAAARSPLRADASKPKIMVAKDESAPSRLDVTSNETEYRPYSKESVVAGNADPRDHDFSYKTKEQHVIVSDDSELAEQSGNEPSESNAITDDIRDDSSSMDRSATEPSFHSAREEVTRKDIVMGVPSGPATTQDSRSEMTKSTRVLVAQSGLGQSYRPIRESPESAAKRPLVRKSSLSFATLPAREPITTKKSLGTRISRLSNLDQTRSVLNPRTFLDRVVAAEQSQGDNDDRHGDMDLALEADLDMNEDIEVVTETIDQVFPGQRARSDEDTIIQKLHNKSSTQRLHDRINLLAKSQNSRPTNSNSNSSTTHLATQAQIHYPELQNTSEQSQATALSQSRIDDDDDDWIKPLPAASKRAAAMDAEKRSALQISAASVDLVSSGSMHGEYEDATLHLGFKQVGQDQSNTEINPTGNPTTRAVPAIAASSLSVIQNSQSEAVSAASAGTSLTGKSATGTTSPWLSRTTPGLASSAKKRPVVATTTPSGSPAPRIYGEGPLSASKTKLQHIMDSARGLFSSSAGVSAQAKLETFPKPPTRTLPGAFDSQMSDNNDIRYDELSQEGYRDGRKELVAQQHLQMERERVLQQELAIKQKNEEERAETVLRASQAPTRQSPRRPPTATGTSIPAPQPGRAANTTTNHTSGKTSPSQRPKDTRRPVKPVGKDTISKAKAPPVSIRIGMPSQRLPLNTAALSSTLQDTLQPISQMHSKPQQAVLGKKASTASLHTSASISNLKDSSQPVPKPKALIVAERKKEQDEREAQRKQDMKREIDRRRALQQEETRRQEESRQYAEEARREQRDRPTASVEEKRLAAQKQAMEKRRLELQKKETAVKILNHKSVTDLKSQTGGAPRPPSRQQSNYEHLRHANAAAGQGGKGTVKRVFDPEGEHNPNRSVRQVDGPSYQTNDSKRRRTGEGEEEAAVRPTMAPPIRQSNIRKEAAKSSIYMPNNTSSHHAHGQSIFKASTSSQHRHLTSTARTIFHADTSKFRDGNKIPFATDPSNGNAATNSRPTLSSQQDYKTPRQQAGHLQPKSQLQSTKQAPSPHYPNGENIVLADIPTDSESSDSDSYDEAASAAPKKSAANLPDWAQSPNLRQLLQQQEDRLDADAVFGPVASPHMEEMFKERHHRFRQRTSSANWAGSDRLTEEEIRRDVEGRARLRRDGGWTFAL